MTPERAMGRLIFGSLREAWKGEASDFTPLLAENLDAIGEAIGVDLLAFGQVEVAAAGGRSIDIVAQVADGPEFVIENQYGRADHDHLTRGLAYAVARDARGLVVIAESHRDEFRAVAQYLNEMAEHDPERGISVWLVEARAAKIATSPWAPLFTAVVSPNTFTAQVEQAKRAQRTPNLDELLDMCETESIKRSWQLIVERWRAANNPVWRWTNSIALAAKGPAKSGVRSVVALYPNGQLGIPFGAFSGLNTGIPIPALASAEFLQRTQQTFGLTGTRSNERTVEHWLSPDQVETVVEFASEVAAAYRDALTGAPIAGAQSESS